MHETKIDIAKKKREQAIEVLSARLADVIDLGLQAKQAHWNVKGPHFYGLHQLFDEIADAMDEHSDMIAERITALAGVAEGTVGVVAKKTTLPEYPLDIFEGRAHVEALSASLATFGKAVRGDINQAEEIGDADTADLFTEVSRSVDKYLWFVEAHLQAER